MGPPPPPPAASTANVTTSFGCGDFDASSGDNQAEPEMRMVKLEQRISDSRRVANACEFCAICSHISKLPKNQRDDRNGLGLLFEGQVWASHVHGT